MRACSRGARSTARSSSSRRAAGREERAPPSSPPRVAGGSTRSSSSATWPETGTAGRSAFRGRTATASPPAPRAHARGLGAAETGAREDRIGAAARFARLALPLTLGEQGPLNGGGIPAVLLQVSGEGGPAASDPVSQERFTNYGRAALRTITALDAGPDITSGPEHGVVLRGRVVPGWAVRLLGGALLVPALIAAVDGLARTRRRREPVGMWVRWVLAGALPFALAALTLPLLRMTDALDAAPPEPVAPGAIPLHGAGMAALAAVLLVLALGWIGIRPVALRLLGVHGDPGRRRRGGGARARGGRDRGGRVGGPPVRRRRAAAGGARRGPPGARVRTALRRWAGAVALAVMVAPAALLAVYYAHAFGMGPIDLAWAAALLVAGGRIGVLDVLAWSLPLWRPSRGSSRTCARAPVTALRSPRSPCAAPPPTRAPARSAGPSRHSRAERPRPPAGGRFTGRRASSPLAYSAACDAACGRSPRS